MIDLGWGSGAVVKAEVFLPRLLAQRFNIVRRLRDREVACSASDRQGSNFVFCVWRAMSFHSSHHLQEVVLAKFSLFVHKGGLKPHLFINSLVINLKNFEGKDWCIASVNLIKYII